jgi:regulatory protein
MESSFVFVPMNIKQLTAQQACERLMNYCSRYETCLAKAKQKLRQWQVEPQQQQDILQYMVEHKFIDDARYADNFVRSRQAARWGGQKIRARLQQDGVDSQIIEHALQQINHDEENAVLLQLLRKKLPLIKAKSSADLYAKLLRYAIGRGYAYAAVSAAIKQVLAKEEVEFCDE